MPELNLSVIAPVTNDEAARLASPAAFADLASRIAATEAPVAPPRAARERAFLPRLGHSHPRRRLALLTAFPVALAAAAALLVTVLSPGGSVAGTGANSAAAIKALSFTKENGTITVVIRNPYADAAWYNADLARHHIPLTLQVIPASPSLVGSIIGGDYAPGVKELTGQRRCYYPSSGGASSPCLIGFTVPTNLKDEGSVWIGGPARPGQQYESTGSIFAPGEALAGLLKQVAGQPLSKVRPILASHHLTVAVCRDKNNNNVNPDSVPGDYYLTNVLPWAPGQVIIWTSPKQFYAGSERVPGMSTGPSAPEPSFARGTPSPSSSSEPVVTPTPGTGS
jgi:hypothetical protein